MLTEAPFEDSTPLLNDAAGLRARMDRDGFFYFRHLLPREAVLNLRRQILEVCQKHGWMDPSAPLMEAIAGPAAGPSSWTGLTRPGATAISRPATR